jgi:hypothetical protein
MSYDFAEHLHVQDAVYSIHAFPLNDYLESLPFRPRFRNWPGCSNGYRATWEIEDRDQGPVLSLVALTAPVEDPLALVFGRADLPVIATWFSGILRGSRGSQRRTGSAARIIYDDEIYLEIVSGRVAREWVLDLRSVPDQTDEELRLSLPSFLWGSRLRGEASN